MWGQETPLEQLLSPCWTVHSHLSHHVAGDVACAAPTLAPVETISVFVSKHLEAKVVSLLVLPSPCTPALMSPGSTPRRIAEECSLLQTGAEERAPAAKTWD